MTHPHSLSGRHESEVLWTQRRDTLKAAAAWVALGGLPGAMAQQRSNVVEFVGDVLLRLLTGAVVSVFGRGARRSIVMPTLTAGIRGTGVYAEVFPDQRSYFCNCYGTVEMNARGQSALSQASYHQSFWGEVEPKNGRFLTPANAINHTDEEVEFLAQLVGQQTAWQIEGKKGVKDGMGYMEQRPPQDHPAMPR
ncbi:MAG: hypothetical protein A3I64_22830 [Burkholderiales bacterium RIFCSPLOWO2_02_FULL_67_64]|nr:MAG: hypothetical protein A3I64_22830 [Burkholderiales bacterium RIFCSPLOWO2_02_FULL_67_64]